VSLSEKIESKFRECSLNWKYAKVPLGYYITLENASDALQRRPEFNAPYFKLVILTKRNFNARIITFYGSQSNMYVMTRTIFGMCCHLGGLCLWLDGLEACQQHFGSCHTRKYLARGTCLPPVRSDDLQQPLRRTPHISVIVLCQYH
jgi:hypothetical protein